VWYFAPNSVVFFKNTTLFFRGQNACEKPFSQGFKKKSSVGETAKRTKSEETASRRVVKIVNNKLNLCQITEQIHAKSPNEIVPNYRKKH
jgi:hypothetical protein